MKANSFVFIASRKRSSAKSAPPSIKPEVAPARPSIILYKEPILFTKPPTTFVAIPFAPV